MKKNKVALVTGASRGIGFSISKLLLENGIQVIGISKTGLFSGLESNENFIGIQCDLADKLDLKKQLKSLLESDLCPEIIINNAGVSEPCLFSETDENWDLHWEKVMQVNLNSPTQLIKWAIPQWKNRKIGTHILIASRAAYRGETESYAAYAASKSAAVGVSKTIARAFGEFGITSTVIAPGFTNTDMATEAIPIYGEAYIKKDNVLNEIIPPEEIAELCLLISQGKVRHLTGSTIHINSGTYMI